MIIFSIILVLGIIGLVIVNISQHKRIKSLEDKVYPTKDIPEGSRVVVTEIPSAVVVDDIDSDYNTLRDIIKSIDIEGWLTQVDKKYSTFNESYVLKFTNPSNTIVLDAMVHLNLDKKKGVRVPSIGFIIVQTLEQEGFITYDKKTMGYDIDLFLVNKILEYHKNQNSETTKYIQNTLNYIQKELKSLNRDRKLNSLVGE